MRSVVSGFEWFTSMPRSPSSSEAAAGVELRLPAANAAAPGPVNAVAPRKYAPENPGVSLFSKGGDVVAQEVKGWKMQASNPR